MTGKDHDVVWGLVDPSSIGDFFPNGDYVGWEERIKQYFDVEMTAEQRAEFDNWDVNYRSEVARRFIEHGAALAPHERPMEYRLGETHRELGSLIKLTDRLLAADEALKDVIETLEPDVHQFWPIRIGLRTGKEHPVRYYGMVIRRFLDSFVPEESSDFRFPAGFELYYVNRETKSTFENIAVLRAAVAGCHLWRDCRLHNPGVFISDELQAEIARRGLRFPKHHRLKLV